MENKPRVLVIVGPTASGKTALAVSLAKRYNGEVISADSRQIYRHLNIGTAKITAGEMRGIPHHLIDIRDPHEYYSVTEFLHDARRCIQGISARNRLPIVAGGTFQYVDALLGRQSFPDVPPQPALRATLEKHTTEELHALLQERDPARATTIDPHNHRRLVRALEIIEILGSVPHAQSSDQIYDTHIIGLHLEAQELKEKIFSRLEQRVNAGLVAETTALLHAGITRDRLREIGLEYRVAAEYIDGLISEHLMRQKLREKVWQYAKRQLTWLRRMHNVSWYYPDMRASIIEDTRIWLSRPQP